MLDNSALSPNWLVGCGIFIDYEKASDTVKRAILFDKYEEICMNGWNDTCAVESNL